MLNFNWDFQYPSQRMPVFAKNIVATSQPLAAQAGLEMIRKGGNAIDAAIASAIALTVVECTNNGIGGDVFTIVWNNKEEKLYGLNASGKSPKSWSFDYFEKRYQEMPSSGWDVVTVPGAVSAWLELSKKFGKLPFEELFLPAIDYARNGFQVSPITTQIWKKTSGKYNFFSEFMKNFTNRGRTPKVGEKITFREQANTLSEIARTGTESFYKGRLADKIADYAQSSGGWISRNDLAEHRAEWIETISINYKGLEVHELPPNGQGIAVLIALGILSNFNIEKYPVDSADNIHLQIEAMKLALADLYQYIADPDYMRLDYKKLLQPDYLSKRAELINLSKAREMPPGFTNQAGDTVYLTTADKEGMMVSLIQSNYLDFGSGIVIPGTGISMQSRGACFNLVKGHPNQVDGGKRPFHTIIPGFIMREGEPLISFGVMGGAMQPQGQVQLIVRMSDYKQNPQSACDAPRWRVLNSKEVVLEKEFKSELSTQLTKRGHKISIGDSSLFGGAQVIYKLKDGYCAASDFRKDGQAVGF